MKKQSHINNYLKTLAIIGSDGMLGSDLLKYLNPYFSITPITRENYHAYRHTTFDVLINANGNGKRFWANKNVLEDFELSTYSVYKSIFDFTFDVYIYISSSDVYEDPSSVYCTDESQHINSSNLSSYGFHKYMSELIVKNCLKKYLILRCSMILGQKLKKGPIYDILHNKSLFITTGSRLQMITTKEIAAIIHFFLKNNTVNDIFNIGGKGGVLFKKINQYFSLPITFSKDAQKQEYEMSVLKLAKTYPLKTSEEYLQDCVNSLL